MLALHPSVVPTLQQCYAYNRLIPMDHPIAPRTLFVLGSRPWNHSPHVASAEEASHIPEPA